VGYIAVTKRSTITKINSFSALRAEMRSHTPYDTSRAPSP
jgi:hypothetical protein